MTSDEDRLVRDEPSRLAIAATALLIFLVAALVMALAIGHEIGVYDEGLILTGAVRVAAGEVPHRNFYANYGPGQFYVIAGLFKLFGPSVLAERLWDIAVRAAITTLAYLIVQAAVARREAYVAAALVGLWLAAIGFPSFPVFPALLFALVALACLIPVLAGRLSIPTLVASGFATGVTTLFRYDVGVYALAALSAGIGLRELARPGSWRDGLLRSVRALLACWAGVALVCVPLALAYVAGGVGPDFVTDILDYPTRYYWRMRSLPFPTPQMLLENPIDIGIYLPPAVWLLALVTMLTRRRWSSVDWKIREWVTNLLVLVSALFYVKGIVRVGLGQMALSIVPALMAAALLLPLTRAGLRARRPIPLTAATLIGLFVLAMPSVLALKATVLGIGHGIAWATRASTWAPASADVSADLAPCHPGPGLGRSACFATDPIEAEAVRYVAANTKPDDTIFVGLDRHDRLYANDNLFYFLAARRPATKWSHFDPGLQTRTDIQAQMIAELQARKPAMILLDAGFVQEDEANDSRLSSGVTLLDDFLRTTYRPVKTFGTTTVMAPK